MTNQSYNPIISSECFENSFFSPIPIPPAGFAFVLTSEYMDSPPLVIRAGVVPTKQQIRAGKYNRKTQVDVRQHLVAFSVDVLAADNVSKFQIEMSMTAQVRQPEDICEANIADVAAVVEATLLPQLQDMAFHKRADEPQRLRETILMGVGNIIQLDCGITLENISVKVELDGAVVEHVKGIRDLGYKEEYEEVRAKKAESISKLYLDPVTRAYAEVASGALSPADAAGRLKAESSADFDEQLRRMREFLALAEKMKDSGLGGPEILTDQAEQLIYELAHEIAPGLDRADGTHKKLIAGVPEELLFAPPND